MLDHVDALLRSLLVARVAGITSPQQVRFQPPDDDWRTTVANLQVDGQPANAINVYLVGLREHRDLRSNARRRVVHDGIVRERHAPSHVDATYLLSAWSPAVAGEQAEPALDEHALLYRILAVLHDAVPLNASRILPAGSAVLDSVPEAIRDVDLPTTVASPDAVGTPSDFWGTMGPGHRWRPTISLTVTLPVVRDEVDVGPVVTTATVSVGDRSGSFDTAASHIGGVVRDPDDRPVIGAWVTVEGAGAAPALRTTTDQDGTFRIGPLPSGRHRVHVRSPGLGDTVADVVVPGSPSEYVVRFT